jgi:hypothetical protein
MWAVKLSFFLTLFCLGQSFRQKGQIRTRVKEEEMENKFYIDEPISHIP